MAEECCQEAEGVLSGAQTASGAGLGPVPDLLLSAISVWAAAKDAARVERVVCAQLGPAGSTDAVAALSGAEAEGAAAAAMAALNALEQHEGALRVLEALLRRTGAIATRATCEEVGMDSMLGSGRVCFP